MIAIINTIYGILYMDYVFYYRSPEPEIPEVPDEEFTTPATGYEVPKCETVYEKRYVMSTESWGRPEMQGFTSANIVRRRAPRNLVPTLFKP